MRPKVKQKDGVRKDVAWRGFLMKVYWNCVNVWLHGRESAWSTLWDSDFFFFFRLIASQKGFLSKGIWFPFTEKIIVIDKMENFKVTFLADIDFYAFHATEYLSNNKTYSAFFSSRFQVPYKILQRLKYGLVMLGVPRCYPQQYLLTKMDCLHTTHRCIIRRRLV